MGKANDMHRVLVALRHTRTLAVETLKHEFPDLYVLSAQAFGTSSPGSIVHHIRLGEFLTEWNNALGRSPVEALANGRHAEVGRQLADRAGIGSGY